MFLKKIRELTAERVARAKQDVPAASLMAAPLFARKPHNVKAGFSGCGIIAEIKFSSPSEGAIRQGDSPVPIAQGYAQGGAAMISVLTEPLYFKGELAYLKAVREALPAMPLLRKDFIIDAYQLLEAKAHGADAVLLIAAMTELSETRDLHARAIDLGLTPLVEVHDEADLDQALEIDARFIGINNRNLQTLKIDLDTSRRLAPRKPKGSLFICESGLSTADDLREMRGIGYDGFLMGSHFMKQPDPGQALQLLRNEAGCA